jgi:superfamily II DNA or RNA helicase
MILRDYQTDIVNKNMDALDRKVASTLNGVFTGAGKTVVFTEMAGRVDGRTLIMAPLRELVWQAVEKVRDILGLDPALEMADYRASEDEWWSPQIVVACKQTLTGRSKRYQKFKDIRLVIVDEAHMQYSPACLEMFRWFNDRGAMVAGFTATPFRMSGEALRDYYQEEICNLDLQWAMDAGWSAPPVCRIARVQSLDLSGIQMSGGDFNQAALAAAVEKEANLHRIALITKEEMNGPTVVFTPSVASAKGVAHYLSNNYGIRAVYVYGTQPDEERLEAIRQFKDGEVQVLCNCQVVATGFDYPAISTLILGRPTRSRVFWLQVAGRATRPLGGVVDFAGSTPESRKAAIAASDKPHFKIVDCTDCSLDHRLITAVDMFTTADQEVKKVIKAKAEQAPLTPEEMDALAQQELERRVLAQQLEERRRQMTGMATGTIVGRDIELTGGRRSVGTYTNPLRGRYAGMRMCELPVSYLEWAAKNPSIKGWPKSLFHKELHRRAKAAC